MNAEERYYLDYGWYDMKKGKKVAEKLLEINRITEEEK